MTLINKAIAAVISISVFTVFLMAVISMWDSRTHATPIPQEIVKISEHIVKVNPSAPADRIAVAIYWSAKVCGVSPYLVTALMETESRFHVDAVSGTGARGLMQIVKSTATYLGLPWELAYDIELNTEKGTCYLAKHVKNYRHRLDLAVKRYNGNDDPYFAQKVLSRYATLTKDTVHLVVVQKGDTLAKLAETYLGSPSAYPTLAAMNGITNPNLIEVGQKIVVMYL